MNTRHDISYRVKEAARNLCRHAGELAYDLSRMFFPVCCPVCHKALVKGENLLAQRYEINAGYPMPKATFMGGINLNF